MSDVIAKVMGLVRRGQTDDLVARLAPVTAAERRAVVVALKEYLKTPEAQQRGSCRGSRWNSRRCGTAGWAGPRVRRPAPT
jgi:hypothetical protein